MNDLNVCLFNDSFPPLIDGVANAVVNYGKYINQNHGKASVVTPYYPNANDEAFDFPVLRYPSLDMTKLVGYRAGLPFNADLQNTIEKADFDIMHTHCPIASTFLARSLQPRIDVPIVLTYHTKFDIDIANAVRGKLLQAEATHLLVENIEACDEVWTVSKGAGENLKSLGYEGDYIVMPNGVDFPVGRVSDELIEQVTAGYDLPHDLPVYLFVGRMMWYKGIRITLDALKLLKDSGKDFRMVFVGAGQDKDEIIAYCEDLGLSDKVFFSPPIRDRSMIRAWYCRADLFLFPSTFDTNGLVVREAAACSLGSVLVAGSCAAEDSTDGEDGYLIEENAQSMFDTLYRLGDNLVEMKRIGEGAQKNLYMSWEDAVANAYERYGIVVDKYKAGEYRKKKELTDEMFRAMADGLAEYTKLRDRRRNRVSNLAARYAGIYSDVEYNTMQLKARMEQLRDKAGLELMQGRDDLERTLEEIYQTMDRFI